MDSSVNLKCCGILVLCLVTVQTTSNMVNSIHYESIYVSFDNDIPMAQPPAHALIPNAKCQGNTEHMSR